MKQLLILIFITIAAAGPAAAQKGPKIFISVDLEGIGGLGYPGSINRDGKDYQIGRDFMTDEVLAVVDAIKSRGPAQIVVNDSHGDHANLMHERLPEDVLYIQGNNKPYGMMSGLDETYDGLILLGYHAMANARGFLAHTAAGKIAGVWFNDIEVGEGGINAAYAGALGVPVILVAGDDYTSREMKALFPTRTVITKHAITTTAARLKHPKAVQKELKTETRNALASISDAKPWTISEPVEVKVQFRSTLHADVLEMVPGVTRIDGVTVSYTSETLEEAYPFFRFMDEYVRP